MTDAPVIDYGTKSRGNRAAVASLIFGLLLFLPLLPGLLAIWFGGAGMRAAREQALGRYRLACAGFVLGIVNLVLTAGVIAAYGVHEYRAAQQQRCADNLKKIGLAMLFYSNEHRGHFPPTFDALVGAGELPKGSPVFNCPSCAGDPSKNATIGSLVTSDYVIGPPWPIPRHFTFSGYPYNLVRAYEPLSNHNGRGIHVLREDGSVEWLRGVTAAKIVGELQQGQNPPPSLK